MVRALVAGIPSDFEQSAQVAEHFILSLLSSVSNLRSPQLVVDCASISQLAALPDECKERYRSPNAGFWRQCRLAGFHPAARKTKAHRSLAEARLQGDEADLVGNAAADSFARDEARAALPPGHQEVLDRIDVLKVLLPWAARMCNLWPPFEFPSFLARSEVRPPRQRAAPPPSIAGPGRRVRGFLSVVAALWLPTDFRLLG